MVSQNQYFIYETYHIIMFPKRGHSQSEGVKFPQSLGQVPLWVPATECLPTSVLSETVVKDALSLSWWRSIYVG